jgi:hypothetical protein
MQYRFPSATITVRRFAAKSGVGVFAKMPRDTARVTCEQIYGCSFWLINYHLP